MDYNNLLPDYNNHIIIYYYYNPRININPSCPEVINAKNIPSAGRSFSRLHRFVCSPSNCLNRQATQAADRSKQDLKNVGQGAAVN